jgi:putative sugar O-methyltransferase
MLKNGTEAIDLLLLKMKNSDEVSSTFWDQYHSNLAYENGNFVGLQMLGGSKRRSILNLLIYTFLERNLQKPFIKEVKNNPSFIKIDTVGRKIAKSIDQIYGFDRLKHSLTLAFLHKNVPELVSNKSKIGVIGDGFATLTSLLLGTQSASQVFLFNLNKSLLVDLSYLKKFLGDVEFDNSVSLVSTQEDLEIAVSMNKRVIAIMASDYHLLQYCPINLAINISSMQEMDVEVVANYFQYIRAIKEPTFFYCCNRVEKILDDGQILRFDEFPWSEFDKKIKDELCPWYQRRYSLKPPFYREYDGPTWHRLAELQKS